MCTSETGSPGREAGFSLIELLVALSLTACIVTAALAVWEGVERTGVGTGDRMVHLIQGRVAIARMSRDLRLASSQDCPFVVSGALLEAASDRVVVLTKSGDPGDLLLVEWQIVGGSLMRRRGSCPASRPSTIANSLFVDHKTMMEDVFAGSRFRFFVSGVEVETPVGAEFLAAIDEVRLDARAGDDRSRNVADVAGNAPVGW